MDSLDAKILLALDDDPSATTVKLAQELSVARNTIQARTRRLQDSGVLRDFTRRVDLRSLGYSLAAFVAISIRQGNDKETFTALAAIPEVIEIHATTGDADLRVRLVAKDTDDMYRVTQKLVGLPGVVRTSTAVVLQELMPLRVAPLLQRRADS